MKKYYLIYKISNTISGKFYIGKHETFDPEDNYFGSGIALKDSIKKYGKLNFIKEIIEFCGDQESLSEREKYWIEKENSTIPNGYNISLGGKGGDNFTKNPNKDLILLKIKENRNPRKWTEEEKEKRRNQMLGKKLKPHTKIECEFCYSYISNANYKRWHGERCKKNPDGIKIETRKKLCIFCNEYKNPTDYSINHDIYCCMNPEKITKQKITLKCENCNKEVSEFNYKKFHGKNCKSNPIYKQNPEIYKKTEAYKIGNKISESNKGKSLSKEHKEKIKNSNKNKIVSEDTKNKSSLSLKKSWEIRKKNPIFYVCEFCNKKTINKTNYVRWHGENCKEL